MSKPSWLTIGLCAVGLAAVWYASSARDASSSEKAQAKKKFKEFIERLFPHLTILSAKVNYNLRPRYPRLSPQSFLMVSSQANDNVLKEIHQAVCREMNMTEELTDVTQILDHDDPEYILIKGEYDKMILCALAGTSVMKPFYIHNSEILSADKIYTVAESIKLGKVENVKKLWQKLGKECGKVSYSTEKKREIFTLTNAAYESLALMATDTEDEVIEANKDILVDGMDTYKNAIVYLTENDFDFKTSMSELEDRQNKLMEKAFDDLISLRKNADHSDDYDDWVDEDGDEMNESKKKDNEDELIFEIVHPTPVESKEEEEDSGERL